AEEMTAWVALSPSTPESGGMRFIPGSHQKQLVAHSDSFDENNLLTRGQEISVEVDESAAADVLLKPGQASLHHGHLFHASGPNTTNDRRIGVAIRYIRPTMKQKSGDRTLVNHVSGEDRYNNFTVGAPPAGRLQAADFALCRADAEIKARLLYEGAEKSGGKRYK
ncbi:MAG: phytanoyl-CoA dioxygenase family protein, partial [Burkholderiaceae bacterium]